MTPENLIRNFIEDYFQWNEKADALQRQIQEPHDADLLSLGIIEPFSPNETIYLKEYLEIKRRYSEGFVNLLAQVEADWQKVIKKYCPPDHKAYYSFGSPSTHDPHTTIIVSVNTVNKKSIVKTQRTDDYGPDYHEFHLIYKNEQWFLARIYSVWSEKKIKIL